MHSKQTRLSRLLGILLMLRSKEWVSAQEIAARFDVSLRTVYRDIEALQRNNVAVRGVPGPEGGYRLETEGPLDVFKLANRDALSIFTLGSAGPEVPDSVRAALEGALRRIQDVIRPEDAQILRLIQQRVYFDTSDWYWRNESTTLMPILREAVTYQRVVKLVYRERGSTTEVTSDLEPFGLVWKSGEWYVVGRNMSREEVVRIRVSRVVRASATEESFPYPSQFDLKQWWTTELERFGMGDLCVRIVATADARPELLALRTKENSAIEELPQGKTRLTLYVDRWAWLIPLLLSYGGSVYVEEPPELRSALVAAMQRALDQYRKELTGPAESAKEGTSEVFLNDDSRQRSTRGRH